MKEQTCKICSNRDGFNFQVPDDIWLKIVPTKYRNRVVCLHCFDKLAFQKDIKYTDSLKAVYFAGSQSVIEFKVVANAD